MVGSWASCEEGCLGYSTTRVVVLWSTILASVPLPQPPDLPSCTLFASRLEFSRSKPLPLWGLIASILSSETERNGPRISDGSTSVKRCSLFVPPNATIVRLKASTLSLQ